MTDPERKPDPLNPDGEPTPARPASEVPDWTRSMTGTGPAPEPTSSVAPDVFADPTPPITPPPPVNDTIIVTPGTPDAGARHQYAAPPPPQTAFQAAPGSAVTDNKKVVAGILGILLGSLGVHKFYLGIQQPAIIMLCITLGCWLLTVVTFGIAGLITIPVLVAMGIIGLVEGVIYLTKTDTQFKQEYEIGKKPWF